MPRWLFLLYFEKPGVPGRVPHGPWEILGLPWEVLGRPWGGPGDPRRSPGHPSGVSRKYLGAFLASLESPWTFFVHLVSWSESMESQKRPREVPKRPGEVPKRVPEGSLRCVRTLLSICLHPRGPMLEPKRPRESPRDGPKEAIRAPEPSCVKTIGLTQLKRWSC